MHMLSIRILSTTAFFVLLILAFALHTSLLVALYILVACAVVLANVNLLNTMSNSERRFAILFVGTLTCMLPISVVRSEAAIAHYFVALISMASAYVMTRDMHLYLKASMWSLVAAQAALLIFLSIVGVDNFPLENLVPDSSSNGITSYLIIIQANYCIAKFLVTRRTPVATSLITLGICIVGYGRGSILAAAGIVIICGFFNNAHKNFSSNVKYFLLTIGISSGILFLFADEVLLFLELNTKIGGGLYDAARDEIIRSYLNLIDGFSFLFGADYDGTSIVTDYRGNPHNSFIRAHHIFGLPYLLLMLFLPFFSLAKQRSVSIKAFCGLMILLMLFRSATEPVILPTIFDFYYFSVCLAFIHRVRCLPTEAASVQQI